MKGEHVCDELDAIERFECHEIAFDSSGLKSDRIRQSGSCQESLKKKTIPKNLPESLNYPSNWLEADVKSTISSYRIYKNHSNLVESVTALRAPIESSRILSNSLKFGSNPSKNPKESHRIYQNWSKSARIG